ncbi:MAG: hypothetical protein JXA21_07400 [Anaerolineae bacterium]|nr:hypothetical protein [Anaerolineae bacterium]
MKTKVCFAFLIIAITFWITAPDGFTVSVLAQETPPEMDIGEAVGQGLVNADVRASGNSYYGSGTLNATLTNTGVQPLTVVIPQGLRFRSQDTTYQDEVVAVTERIPLQPGETVEMPLTSFCGNAHRAAPSTNSSYVVGEMETPRLRNLLKEIENEGLQDNIQGQWAVWGQTDDMPVAPLSDFSDAVALFDSAGSNGVGRQVAISAPTLDGALLQQLAWAALFKTLLPWLLLALGLFLLALLLWWLLHRPTPAAVSRPTDRTGSYSPRKEPPKTTPRTGESITHGQTVKKRGK